MGRPQIPTLTLNTGAEIPQLGFGVFKVPPQETVAAVSTALDVGYRSIDTAAVYGNEEPVGKAIAASGIPREELFITTKLWNDKQAREDALQAFDASLDLLGLDYVDLYLIHWPAPQADRYVEAWRALEQLHADGRARAIGVSNFQPAHLRRLLDETDTVPALNQIELHPQLQQAELRRFHAEHEILTEAWGPLARGGELLRHPTITGLADRYGKTPAQIVLRWHMEIGTIAIPKSVTPARIEENLDSFGFALDADALAAIAALDSNGRTGPNPDEFG
ncbi:MAG TPA: aldo/keto reductase [Thermoleophilaceae bacterium]